MTPHGEAKITLSDGRKLTLRRSLRAIAVAERTVGRSADVMRAEIESGGPVIESAASFLYGMLQAHHPEISFDETFAIMETDMALIMETMNKVTADSAAPVKKGAATSANPPKRRGTGTRSTPLGAKKG